MSFILGALLFFILSMEILRMNIVGFNEYILGILGKITRGFEKHSISGATYFIAGCFFVTVLFSKNIAISGMLVLIFSDTFAAIIGINYGKHKIVGNKSVEGSAAFCISSLIAGQVMGFNITSCALASFGATVVELFAKRLYIDDNLLIPVTYAALIYAFI